MRSKQNNENICNVNTEDLLQIQAYCTLPHHRNQSISRHEIATMTDNSRNLNELSKSELEEFTNPMKSKQLSSITNDDKCLTNVSSSSSSSNQFANDEVINFPLSQDLSSIESTKDDDPCGLESVHDDNNENFINHHHNNSQCNDNHKNVDYCQQKQQQQQQDDMVLKNIHTLDSLKKSKQQIEMPSIPISLTLDRRKILSKNHNNNNVNEAAALSSDNNYPYCTIRRDEKIKRNSLQLRQCQPIQNGMDFNVHDNEMIAPASSDKQNHKEYQKNDSVTRAEAFNILNELDVILNNHSTSSTLPSSTKPMHATSTLSLPPSSSSLSPSLLSFTSLTSPRITDDTKIFSPSISPSESIITDEKVVNCLLELDVYLDGIDNDDNNFEEQTLNQSLRHQQCKNHLQNLNRSKTLPKNHLNSKTSNTRNNNNDNFDRCHRYRNTITGNRIVSDLTNKEEFMPNGLLTGSTTTIDDDEEFSTSLNTNENNMHKELSSNSLNNSPRRWRRRSMRKTSPFQLPDQQEITNIAFTTPLSSLQQTDHSNDTDMFIDSPSIDQENKSSMPSVTLQSSGNVIANQALDENSLSTTTNAISSTTSTLNNQFRRCHSQTDCTLIPSSSSATDNQRHLDVIYDILQNSSCENEDDLHERPRQFGRRADQHPRIVSIMAETNSSGSQRIIVNHDRPLSAPAAATARMISSPPSSTLLHHHQISRGSSPPLGCTSSCSRYVSSEPSSVNSSRNPSPISLLSSTASSSTAASTGPDQVNDNSTQQRTSLPNSSPIHVHVPRTTGNNSQWPHDFSRLLALLSCTLGLFNISRFSILTIHYGGNFLLQFLLLSIIFGIPMLWLQMCLGAKIKGGPVSMWKISPICKGIGISLIVAQCVIALYSTISLGWVMVYLRDSFISRNEFYRWQEPFYGYLRSKSNVTNIGSNLTETVADYFNGIVLQRWQLGLGKRADNGGVRFQLAFNLAIIWTTVFIALCKGLKSFGKIVLGLTLVPLILFIVVTCKMLYVINFPNVQNIFVASDFEDFLINSKTWTAAAQETFLTWTLMGPSIIAISCKSAEKTEAKTILRRDAMIVAFLTLFGLTLAGVFGYACVQILQNNDYTYIPGSYENLDSYPFLYSLHGPIPPNLLSLPIKWSPHYSSVLGECYRRPPVNFRESGYQALRLITELFPAAIAVATQESISSVWSIITFLMFLLFGIGQLCAMWKPISSALGDSTSSVLLSCVTGLLLGIPFATEMGLSIIHYLDTILGGAWWILVLWTAQILAVFLIRGRPYNGDDLVKDLRMSGSMSAFLALSWNVLLPVGLITLAIVEYKISLSNQFFHWRNKGYFLLWTRKVGGLVQISFLLMIPVVAIIQIYRYLTTGPPDILDRIQLLYRPQETSQSHPGRTQLNPPERSSPTTPIIAGDTTLTNLNSSNLIQEDAPPKYTPPPSYTTATGARIAKLLRQSIRRSVRRILGESSRNTNSIQSSSTAISHHTNSILPPEYSTVLCNPSGIMDLETGSRMLYNNNNNNNNDDLSHSTTSNQLTRPLSETLPTRRSLVGGNRNRHHSSAYTQFNVTQILRPSSALSTHHNHRHERSFSTLTAGLDNILRSSSLRHSRLNHNKKTSHSIENLVLNAAPLGESNAIALDETTTIQQESQTDNTETQRTNCNENNTSVI